MDLRLLAAQLQPGGYRVVGATPSSVHQYGMGSNLRPQVSIRQLCALAQPAPRGHARDVTHEPIVACRRLRGVGRFVELAASQG